MSFRNFLCSGGKSFRFRFRFRFLLLPLQPKQYNSKQYEYCNDELKSEYVYANHAKI